LAIENTTNELSSANPHYHTTNDASDRAANTGAVTYDYTFATHVAQAVVYMASLPLDANVQFLTVMATKMPFIGRG
jgi:NADP-dependent 3-hydroxy acid dehydrogenase YdfG